MSGPRVAATQIGIKFFWKWLQYSKECIRNQDEIKTQMFGSNARQSSSASTRKTSFELWNGSDYSVKWTSGFRRNVLILALHRDDV